MLGTLLLASACTAFQIPRDAPLPPRMPRPAVWPDGKPLLLEHPALHKVLRDGDTLQTKGHYAKAARKYRSVGRELELQLGREALPVRDALRALATVELERGRLRQAEKLALSSLVREQQVRPRSGKRSARAHSLLVDVYLAVGQHLKAVHHANQALDLRIRLGGKADLQTSFAYLDQAAAELANKQYQKASHLMRRVMSIQDVHLGKTHLDRVRSLGVWSHMMHLEAQSRAAEVALERAITIMEREKGKTHPRLVPLLHQLTYLFELHGRWPEARDMAIRTRDILDQLPGEVSEQESAEVRERLFLLELGQGRLAEARAALGGTPAPPLQALLALEEGEAARALTLAQESLANLQEEYGAEHTRTTLAWEVLSECHLRTGSLRLAANYARRARDRSNRVFSKKGRETFASKVQLARCLLARGDLEEAENVVEDVDAALQRLDSVLRENGAGKVQDHPLRSECLVVRGHLALEARDYPLATRLFQEAHDQTRASFGFRSSRLISPLLGQAELAHRKGERNQVREAVTALEPLMANSPRPDLQAALDLHRIRAERWSAEGIPALAALAEATGKALGGAHPLVLRIQFDQASLSARHGQADSARKLWQTVRTGAEEVFAKGSPFLLRARLDQGLDYLDQGQFELARPLLKRTLFQAQDHLPRGHPLTREIAAARERAEAP